MAHDSGFKRDWGSAQKRGVDVPYMKTVGTTNELDPLRAKHVEVAFPVVRICAGCENAQNRISPAQELFRLICGVDGAEVFTAANYASRRVVLPESALTTKISAAIEEIRAIYLATQEFTSVCSSSETGGRSDIYCDGEKVGYQCGATGEDFTKD